VLVVPNWISIQKCWYQITLSSLLIEPVSVPVKIFFLVRGGISCSNKNGVTLLKSSCLLNLLNYLKALYKLITNQLHPFYFFGKGSKQIVYLSWKLKLHYLLHKSPPLNLIQENRVHILIFLYSDFNFKLSFRLWLYLAPWSLPFMLFNLKFYAFLIFTMCFM
jgi:hypothetical protein